jgi:cell division protein FtsZ
VIGTVIDPEMASEIRVTVVATGLGQGAIRPQHQPHQQEPMRIVTPPAQRQRETNYRDLEAPAVQRKQAIPEELMGDDEALQEMLDVPAFLRRQAN